VRQAEHLLIVGRLVSNIDADGAAILADSRPASAITSSSVEISNFSELPWRLGEVLHPVAGA
jgi:hypothetical protein